MPLKSIGIKAIGIGLKAKRFKKHAPKAIKAGLYGTGLLATGKVAKTAYKAGHLYSYSEISVTILNIIRKAYRSEAFYRARWKIKSQILAKKIANNPIIQTSISEVILATAIYEIIKRHKNKQGTEKLAEDIENAIIEHEIRKG